MTLSIRYLNLTLVLRKIVRWLVVSALCISVGGPWLALQSIAWGVMIAKYSQSGTIAQAVAQTFDGQHACSLCQGIAKAQQSEKKREAQSLPSKPDLICATRFIVLAASHKEFSYPLLAAGVLTVVHRPAVPPPRSELA